MKVRVGSTLEERFQILSEIGEGGFGYVYRAWDLQLKREVAIKLMKSSASDESCARFQREAKLLGMLSHQNIANIYAFGLTNGSIPFIVMEYLQGKSLQKLFSQVEKLDLDMITTILDQCCDALSYAHKAGIVHRDPSPANIFLLDDQHSTKIKLLDFGLSKFIALEPGKGNTLTTTGSIVGNPSYMSGGQPSKGFVNSLEEGIEVLISTNQYKQVNRLLAGLLKKTRQDKWRLKDSKVYSLLKAKLAEVSDPQCQQLMNEFIAETKSIEKTD